MEETLPFSSFLCVSFASFAPSRFIGFNAGADDAAS
jgi:hypothetical protein